VSVLPYSMRQPSSNAFSRLPRRTCKIEDT
jgi:hypothetical protein